ncbi:MAG: TerD family protein [Alphaproteobacteria bacterium]
MIATPAKGESVALHITPSDKLRVQIGMSWDTARKMVKKGLIFKKEEMVNVTFDLDLFCCIYNKDNELIDHVTPENANLMDESEQIFHSGDNQTGRISGDDEYISLNMALLPENIHSIVFFAMVHDKQAFKDIANVQIRVADGASDENQLELHLQNMTDATTDSFIFVCLHRDDSKEHGWMLKNISEFKNSDSVEDWAEEGKAFLP